MELPVISLFSGAGGLDLGVEDAGGSVRVSVEPDSGCVATLNLNARFFPGLSVLPKPIQFAPTDEILDAADLAPGEAALVIGGPPCQPFSKAGYWRQDERQGLDDPRASMLGEFLRVLRQARPEGFVFENVPSLVHPSNREALESFERRARRYGYTVERRILNAAEYGVPQTRVRLFVLGLRGSKPPFPMATHWWGDRPAAIGARLRPPETAGRWIAGLDRPELEEPSERSRGRWEKQLREVPPGWNYKWHTAWAGHSRPTFMNETKYWSFLLKLSPTRPSWTIQASAGPWTGPLHWDSRRLRVPELAALQTFPSSYRFSGGLTDQRRQIGNAVPSLLASRVVAEILAEIGGKRPKRGRRLRHNLSDGFDFDPAQLAHSGRVW
jgi:DNA (cytosine-5)-methyltransferase 1